MKRAFMTLFVTVFCATSIFAITHAMPKEAMGTSVAKSHIAMWLGTWNCTSGKEHYQTTFKPLLDGTAMWVSDTGVNKAEGLARFDAGRNAWFYTAVTGDGTYFSMMGPVVGKRINFRSVFPDKTLTLNIVSSSKSMYTDVFTMKQNGKTTSVLESCIKS